MFLKLERPETDDFAIKKLVVKEKYLVVVSVFQEIMRHFFGYKNILKMSLHIPAFQNIPSIFYFVPTKTYIFLADKGFAPPPLMDMSAKNVSFFWTAPLSNMEEELQSKHFSVLENFANRSLDGLSFHIIIKSYSND